MAWPTPLSPPLLASWAASRAVVCAALQWGAQTMRVTPHRPALRQAPTSQALWRPRSDRGESREAGREAGWQTPDAGAASSLAREAGGLDPLAAALLSSTSAMAITKTCCRLCTTAAVRVRLHRFRSLLCRAL